jgi:hypothetical protein
MLAMWARRRAPRALGLIRGRAGARPVPSLACTREALTSANTSAAPAASRPAWLLSCVGRRSAVGGGWEAVGRRLGGGWEAVGRRLGDDQCGLERRQRWVRANRRAASQPCWPGLHSSGARAKERGVTHHRSARPGLTGQASGRYPKKHEVLAKPGLPAQHRRLPDGRGCAALPLRTPPWPPAAPPPPRAAAPLRARRAARHWPARRRPGRHRPHGRAHRLPPPSPSPVAARLPRREQGVPTQLRCHPVPHERTQTRTRPGHATNLP